MSLETFAFANRDELVQALAAFVVHTLERGIAARGTASLILSGGSTPVPLFRALSERPCQWAKVQVGLADERWVDPQDPESNERLVREHLLRNLAAEAHFTGLVNEAETPELGLAQSERRMERFTRPFDLVLLGMGNDGHFASLFPNGDHLMAGLAMDSTRICVPMRAPGAAQPRMSLTLAALLQTRELLLLLTGSEKRKVLESAHAAGAHAEMPVRTLLRQSQIPLKCFWAP